MSNNGGHASVHDYLSDFQQLVEQHLPEELPGAVSMSNLVAEFVGMDKRTVLLYVQTSATHALRIRYKMPVPAGGARLFDGEGLMPHTEPTFSTVPIADIEANAAAAAGTMRPWAAEFERIAVVETGGNTAGIRRKARNILIYWNLMRPLLRTAIKGIGIRTSSNLSSSNASSSPASSSSSNHPLLPVSSTARSSSSRRGSRGTSMAAAASSGSRRISSRSNRGHTPDPSSGRRSSSWYKRKTARRKTTNSDPR
jgi:hypothetical protein